MSDSYVWRKKREQRRVEVKKEKERKKLGDGYTWRKKKKKRKGVEEK